MSAKVQPVDAFEAVCFECDWYGETHDEDCYAAKDADHHNAIHHRDAS